MNQPYAACVTAILITCAAVFVAGEELKLQRADMIFRQGEARSRFLLDMDKFKTDLILRMDAQGMKPPTGEPKIEIPTETPTPAPKVDTMLHTNVPTGTSPSKTASLCSRASLA